MRETALVVPVPEAEPIVGEWRRRYDPTARRGVPAHITLLFPFAPPSEVDANVDALREVFAAIAVFDFALAAVGRFPRTAYLRPEPENALLALIDALMRRWPQFPPHGGRFDSVIPHLTVADGVSADVLDVVEQALSPRLPIACRADAAWLLRSDAQGRWSCACVFPFAQAATA
jgi:2'-5' RNA ligase